MAELVDAQDLKSCGSQIPCRFKSGLRHHFFWRSTQVWLKGPVLKTGRSCKRRRGSNPFFSANLNFIAGWSSLVARRAHNPKVVGSNPSPATMLITNHLVSFFMPKIDTREELYKSSNIFKII